MGPLLLGREHRPVSEPGVTSQSVCTIENLLLQHSLISSTLGTLNADRGWQTVTIEFALNEIVQGRHANELRMRVSIDTNVLART